MQATRSNPTNHQISGGERLPFESHGGTGSSTAWNDSTQRQQRL